MPELRKDPVVGRWVIISTERSRRPTNFTAGSHTKSGGFCPFCPGNEDKTPPEVYAIRPEGGVANGPGWSVRVVPNKFPALQIEGGLDRRGEGLYDRMNGVGAHEVIIESPDHDAELADLPAEHIRDVLLAYRERMLDLNGDRRLRYVLIFKNHGAAAGATLEHTHSQLIATPIIPRVLQEELEGSRRYFELKERCVFCDVVHQETEDGNGRRVVGMTDGFVALEPFAPRFPFETWILPRRHDAAFHSTDDPANEYLELAGLLRDTLRRLNQALDRPPYNFVLHTSPVSDGDLEYFHWHIEIMPHLTNVAGFEMGSGFHINPTPPEDAAQYLRQITVEEAGGGAR
ncbi:MAG: galactose-1-phosphate uridylyltransferase [Candidatus Eisenbacteria bacterium]|uniref:Galactose-1-phosphate uridylyltransferase n=1 Tax=Eiseniibacteriota bacterium TaxID=2212470 RepID=A0A9D6L638_UNCEI|nr:galactose-1-phosphate uridylyltransferase [Candidatus Eisenbacteria bacterium]MBI3539311.1 galactose-1-phosphate uridylyltransferase [Candidatus Eisenbacteria bacterium]